VIGEKTQGGPAKVSSYDAQASSAREFEAATGANTSGYKAFNFPSVLASPGHGAFAFVAGSRLRDGLVSAMGCLPHIQIEAVV
jgi:hypothetical protein